MKVLLDENVPRKLRADLREHAVLTVRDCGWAGVYNGALLKLMVEKNFNAFITIDKNLRHQQNLSKVNVTIVVLDIPDNDYESVRSCVKQLKNILAGPLRPGVLVVKSESR